MQMPKGFRNPIERAKSISRVWLRFLSAALTELLFVYPSAVQQGRGNLVPSTCLWLSAPRPEGLMPFGSSTLLSTFKGNFAAVERAR